MKARRDKAFLNKQCKEIKGKNIMGKTRDLFKKIRDTKGKFHAKMGALKDKNGMDLTECVISIVISRVINLWLIPSWGFPGDSVVKKLPANAGDARDMDSIPGSGRSSVAGPGNSLQYTCLENSTDRGAWLATVHGVTKSQTRLRD